MTENNEKNAPSKTLCGLEGSLVFLVFSIEKPSFGHFSCTVGDQLHLQAASACERLKAAFLSSDVAGVYF